MSPAGGPPVDEFAGDESAREKDAVHVDVLRGDPTPEELAAVVAVVTESYQREASDALAESAPRLSAWQVSARALREPLRRETGWGHFGG